MNLSWLALVGICLAVTLRGTQGAVDIAQWGGTGDDNLNGMATLRGSADSLRGIDFVVVGSTLSDDIDNVNTDGDLGGLDGFAARLDNVTLAPYVAFFFLVGWNPGCGWWPARSKGMGGTKNYF